MLRRKALDRLMKWKERPSHKSLLIKGQRQVGKTFILKEFAKTYETSAYIDLSNNADMRAAFDGDIDVDDIVTSIEISNPGLELRPGNCLIILDEIQSYPRARTSLKTFTIDRRYDVIASGSLLDVRMGSTSDTSLIPVGYEEHMRMYGLDFEEFLWGKGYSEKTVDSVKKSIRDRTELKPVVLKAMEEAFRDFMTIGGMPEAVQQYVDNEGIVEIQRTLDNILLSSKDDMTKFSPENETLRIIRCYDSIPNQLSETNKRFMYSRIDGTGSRTGSRQYMEALLWIEGAGIGNFCYQMTDLNAPASKSTNMDQFKVYMSDTGLLIRKSDGNTNTILSAIRNRDEGFNQGAVMENEIAECLMKSGYKPHYYIKRNGKDMMELDFVIDLGSELTAIEVKSGKDRFAPSLKKTLKMDCKIDRRIVFENANIGVDDDGIEHYPLFVASFMDLLRTDSELSIDNDPVVDLD